MIELDKAEVQVANTAADGYTTILRATTLQLTEHRISIIGSNGSGKSTLSRLLNGLILPTSGAVRVRGARESGVTHGTLTNEWFDTSRQGGEVRRRVGFMFTDPSAQLVMPTAIEDVALSLRRHHTHKQDRLAAARAALDRFGLGAFADRSVHTLSGGQRQLLALASVLATDPEIIVADEPTTLLDLRNATRIRGLLMGLTQQVIVATHDLELAARADRTLVIEGARVAFDGSPTEAIEFYRDVASQAETETQ